MTNGGYANSYNFNIIARELKLKMFFSFISCIWPTQKKNSLLKITLKTYNNNSNGAFSLIHVAVLNSSRDYKSDFLFLVTSLYSSKATNNMIGQIFSRQKLCIAIYR